MGAYRSAIFVIGGAVCVFLLLITFGQNAIVSVVLAVTAFAFLAAAAGMRCPRCGLGLDSREPAGYGFGYVPDANCPKCGRSRKGVWPFQFLFKPERHQAG